MRFKQYLLTETTIVLAQRIGDVLNALTDLQQNAPSMGTRQSNAAATTIVNQIRRILHTHWPRKETQLLPSLQKVGVAIMKAIEEKGDLTQVIGGSVGELQKLSDKMGTPINSLASGGPQPPEQQSPMSPSQGPPPQPQQPPQGQQQQQQQAPPPPNQPGQPPPGGSPPQPA